MYAFHVHHSRGIIAGKADTRTVNEESLLMNLKHVSTAALIAVILASFASCARSEAAEAPMREESGAPGGGRSFAKLAAAESAPAPRSEAADLAVAPAPEASATAGNSAHPGAATERKLVRTASLRLRVSDLASSEEAAQKLTASFGGYVASSNKSEESVSMSLRIPRASFDAALVGIAPLGTELWRNLNTEDVTLHWYDLEGRLETKRELMTTLRSYLKRANTIEDIMAVETRLADLQNEIDSLGGQFRRLSDLVDFATINVEFILPAARVKNVEPSLWERIGDVLRGTGSFFSTLIAALVGLVVFGVPIALLAALLFWLLFGKVGLLLSLFRAISRPRKTVEKDAGTK
jgi:hypothetical protein